MLVETKNFFLRLNIATFLITTHAYDIVTVLYHMHKTHNIAIKHQKNLLPLCTNFYIYLLLCAAMK